jgi:hypothetical protein
LLSTKASHYWGEGVVLLDMNLHNKWSTGSLSDVWIF